MATDDTWEGWAVYPWDSRGDTRPLAVTRERDDADWFDTGPGSTEVRRVLVILREPGADDTEAMLEARVMELEEELDSAKDARQELKDARQELKDARQELKDAKRKHADSLKRVREGSAKDLANAEADVWGAEQRQARAETITELREAELEGFKRGHAFRIAELQGRG
jgi:FtsZ-binding cell division protein ZapB